MTDHDSLWAPLYAAGYRLAQGPWLDLGGRAYQVPACGYLSGMLGSGASVDVLVRGVGGAWKLDRPEARKQPREEQDPIFGGRR